MPMTRDRRKQLHQSWGAGPDPLQQLPDLMNEGEWPHQSPPYNPRPPQTREQGIGRVQMSDPLQTEGLGGDAFTNEGRSPGTQGKQQPPPQAERELAQMLHHIRNMPETSNEQMLNEVKGMMNMFDREFPSYRYNFGDTQPTQLIYQELLQRLQSRAPAPQEGGGRRAPGSQVGVPPPRPERNDGLDDEQRFRNSQSGPLEENPYEGQEHEKWYDNQMMINRRKGSRPLPGQGNSGLDWNLPDPNGRPYYGF